VQKYPALQSPVGAVRPVPEQYLPPGHGLQLAREGRLVWSENVPVGQFKALMLPAKQYRPAGQSTRVDNPVVAQT
jgi:hypothetical protein